MKPLHLRKFKLKYAVISLMTCVCLLLNPMAIGRTQDLDGSIRWRSYGLVGDVAYAPVRLDGRNLFSIATARPQEDSGQWGLEREGESSLCF